MRLKITFLTAIFCVFAVIYAFSKETDKYILIHKNFRNDSLIKPSPLASGYDHCDAYEFTDRTESLDVMRKRVEKVIDKAPNESQEKTGIFGTEKEQYLFLEESGTLLQELDEEAFNAIIDQKTASEAAVILRRQSNMASYAASVEAKKKRDKEAEVKDIKRLENGESPHLKNVEAGHDKDVEEAETGEEDPDSIVISGGNGTKIKIGKAGDK